MSKFFNPKYPTIFIFCASANPHPVNPHTSGPAHTFLNYPSLRSAAPAYTSYKQSSSNSLSYVQINPSYLASWIIDGDTGAISLSRKLAINNTNSGRSVYIYIYRVLLSDPGALLNYEPAARFINRFRVDWTPEEGVNDLAKGTPVVFFGWWWEWWSWLLVRGTRWL